MKIKFGKHKGKEIHDLPKPYLRWLRDNILDLDEHHKQAINAGLDGKPYTAPTREQRIDDARHAMTARLKARETGRTLFRVVA